MRYPLFFPGMDEVFMILKPLPFHLVQPMRFLFLTVVVALTASMSVSAFSKDPKCSVTDEPCSPIGCCAGYACNPDEDVCYPY
ncbi:hypothetical protein DFH29DRAFT_435518 [Suillus ampliporus]|nr:hypothetical protein DFH29DRAFT_435518 [Suillus ampliporus]